MTKMPALFVGHGSPTNVFEDNIYTRQWQAMGKILPRPKAILAISGHWYFSTSAVTAMANPRTIHDFYNFPPKFYDYEYPAPGVPELADRIVELAKPLWAGADRDQWGLDHGTWSVLHHIFPEADIPVAQLSLNGVKPMEYHVEFGRKIAALREEGVMVMGSGNIVHNLGRIAWDKPLFGEDWAERFDKAVKEKLATDPANILEVLDHPDYDLAVPTPDHFIPILYLAGMAAEEGITLKAWSEGYALGGLSMTGYALGLDDADLEKVKAAGEMEPA